MAALAGLALLGAIATNISVAMKNDGQRDAAYYLLASASGMHFLGLSSVFWGICIGVIAHFILTHAQLNHKLIFYLGAHH